MSPTTLDGPNAPVAIVGMGENSIMPWVLQTLQTLTEIQPRLPMGRRRPGRAWPVAAPEEQA